jgi:polysaccharide biosynthesis protein PslH
MVTLYESPEFQRVIDEDVRSTVYDLIHVEHYYTYHFVAPYRNVPRFISSHNIESDFYSGGRTFVRRCYEIVERPKVLQYEAWAYSSATAVSFVSERDREAAIKLGYLPADRAFVVHRGVDLSRFRFSFQKTNMESICFVGTMDFGPNVEACEWFVREIFSKLIEQRPSARLLVIGSRPDKRILRFHNNRSIIVTGTVTDVGEYVARCNVFIAPFLRAAGIKMKLLEAAAMGIPIIGPSSATQGLAFGAGDFYQAETKAEWLEGLTKLLSDDDLRFQVASRARRLVEDKYSWVRSGQELQQVYEYLVARSRQ